MTSPRLPSYLLRAAVDPAELRYVLSDLNEEFETLVKLRGKWAATRWYWSQAVRSIGPSIGRRLRKPRRHKKSRQSRRGREIFMLVLLDIRYALRGFLRTPVFTAVTLITLALGIGAGAAIFSIVHGVLLRPLPYPNPTELVTVWEMDSTRADRVGWVSPPNFLDWQEYSESFSHLAVVSRSSLVWTEGDLPERVSGYSVSPAFFGMLGVEPEVGRLFVPEDEDPNGEPIAVLSHGFWQRRLGADPAAVGRTVDFDGRRHRIVGVLPNNFEFLQPAEVWTPVRFAAEQRREAMRGARYLEVIGRLAVDRTFDGAQSEMSALAARLAPVRPNNAGWGVKLVPLHDDLVGDVRGALFLLFGAVGFVLLIVCANVANLVMARSTGRLKESAVRAALGASKARLFGQVLTENLLMSLMGGMLGLTVAYWSITPLLRLAPADVPRLETVGLNGTVFLFALGVSLVTGLVFAGAAAAFVTGSDPKRFLSTAGLGGGVGRQRMRSVLVVGEVALSLVLLIGAGLMTRSFAQMRSVDPGFVYDGVTTLTLGLPSSRYGTPEAQSAFYAELLEGLGAIDGVTSVGLTQNLPMSGSAMNFGYGIDGREVDDNQRLVAEYHAVSADYFRTMGIPMLRGRTFDAAESHGDRPAVIINSTLARRHWGDDDPLGDMVTVISQTGPVSREVVGVIADLRHAGLAAAAREEVYVPMGSDPWRFATVALRVDESVGTIDDVVRSRVASIDGAMPVDALVPMRDLKARWLAPLRFQMTIVGSFAGLALLLAGLGIYGVISFSVGARRSEMGLRVALGADGTKIVNLVLRQGMSLAVVGIVLGLAAASFLMTLVRSFLFEVSPHDPVTFAAISAAALVVALLASYIPARRATQADPVAALRAD